MVGVGVALMVGLALTGLAQALVVKVATGIGEPRPRGAGAGAGHHPAGLPDDDRAPQRGDAGRRLHVDGERPDPRRHRRARHAARGRGQRRLLGADRAVRVRGLRVPHPRALRHRRSSRRSTACAGTADDPRLPARRAGALCGGARARGDPGLPRRRRRQRGRLRGDLRRRPVADGGRAASSATTPSSTNSTSSSSPSTPWSASRPRCSAPPTSATRSRPAGCRRASCDSTTPCSRR